ncbi:hypothetical protein DEU56DRAFT_978178 [Suillus clintonianus]|uniref:uncharacterized protein n=1 Tax=Suillus clintonianus TaxID=1904413 RepID=UPI001B86B15A|nr:uncharacterized protein DEU56DRAFT_978178 [Suillus clintonianus]KAG2148951.1 hypothetical protein DEU56DRAFT_978178 [Suillus clintonianus]
MQGLGWVGLLLLYYAAAVSAAGDTTCYSSKLDWYTSAVGETPCMTYQRLRQICNSSYEVGDFSQSPPVWFCDDHIADCCCNSVAFALGMLCMNCQEDAVTGEIDAAPGMYTAYLATCGTPTNQSLPASIQQAVCNENIKIDNFLYNGSYWTDGSWNYQWTVDYALEQQAIYNNNTFTACPIQVSPSASLPASTTVPTAGASAASALSSSSGNATPSASSTSRKAIIGGAVGGAAFAIVAVLGGVYCYRRRKRPRMIQDTPSLFTDQFPDAQSIYGASLANTEPVVTQRYSSLSPNRRNHWSRKSTLPMLHSLSPERAQFLDTSTGPSYFANDNLPRTASYIREDDAGTLISRGAPTERLPPAYHPSWVSRNTPASNSDPSEVVT